MVIHFWLTQTWTLGLQIQFCIVTEPLNRWGHRAWTKRKMTALNNQQDATACHSDNDDKWPCHGQSCGPEFQMRMHFCGVSWDYTAHSVYECYRQQWKLHIAAIQVSISWKKRRISAIPTAPGILWDKRGNDLLPSPSWLCPQMRQGPSMQGGPENTCGFFSLLEYM